MKSVLLTVISSSIDDLSQEKTQTLQESRERVKRLEEVLKKHDIDYVPKLETR